MTDETVDILLVEDSEDDAAFFTHALKEAGLTLHVRFARDGVAALESIFGPGATAGARPLLLPRLIILDLKLPRLSGVEVLHFLKSNPFTRSLPVVVLSSSQEKRDLAECYHLGVNSYLVKPMDYDEYSELVRTLGRYWLQYNQVPKQEHP